MAPGTHKRGAAEPACGRLAAWGQESYPAHSDAQG